MRFVKKQQTAKQTTKSAQTAGLVLDMETIRLVMKAMDSEGGSLRATYNLKLRKQACHGSNEIR